MNFQSKVRELRKSIVNWKHNLCVYTPFPYYKWSLICCVCVPFQKQCPLFCPQMRYKILLTWILELNSYFILILDRILNWQKSCDRSFFSLHIYNTAFYYSSDWLYMTGNLRHMKNENLVITKKTPTSVHIANFR